jgi:hypothetical protein
MELLADRDPEDARKLLDPVLERMMEAVHRYEGTVNQVMGDGIMALFGAPLAHEDHAVRACYAALRIQESVKRYAEEVHRIEISARRDPPEVAGAAEHYGHALALADELGMRPLVAHCHLGLGKLYRRTGDRAKAEEHLSTTRSMYREMDMGFWLEKADAELGGVKR